MARHGVWAKFLRPAMERFAGVRTPGPHAGGPDMRTGGPHSGKASGPGKFLLPSANPRVQSLMIVAHTPAMGKEGTVAHTLFRSRSATRVGFDQSSSHGG